MQTQTTGEPAEQRLVLNEANVRMLWSKTYNTDGKPDWSHLFPYYHEEITFQDSIQRIEGKEDVHRPVPAADRPLQAAAHGHRHACGRRTTKSCSTGR